MKTLLIVSLLCCGAAFAASPTSINNDDSCDIKVGPAATLLLPYFEVDVNGTSGRTTLFTITNVTRYPQIAHVTLWTDWAYPVLTFNLFLTGYDVQAINLYDIIVRGIVSPPSGTASPRRHAQSEPSGGNLRANVDCAGATAVIPASILLGMRNSLTTGVFNPGAGTTACSTAGSVHSNAIGYATIDVVASCTNLLPSDPNYYATDLLFDNVLIGDYQQIGTRPAGTGPATALDMAGNPMVHIRAVPEGGGAGSHVSTALPYTFYDRYTPATSRTIDRRQPLPSTFAVRYIQGGNSAFATNLTIWREGSAGSSCASYQNNNDMAILEIVRFDEHENPFVKSQGIGCTCGYPPDYRPATSSTSTAGSSYPALAGADTGGWIYLNLSNGGSPLYSITNHPSEKTTEGPATTPFGTPRASQNWVTATIFGNAGAGRMTAELDAAPLGNGCTPSAAISTGNFGAVPIGPAGGTFLCPPETTLTNGTTTQCRGTNANPKP